MVARQDSNNLVAEGSIPYRVTDYRKRGDADCSNIIPADASSASVDRLRHSEAAPTVQSAGAAKYQRVGQMMIRPLVIRGQHSAFDLARLFYQQYSNLCFDSDLMDYHRNGYVISQPHLFAMFKTIIHEGRRGWFVRILVGNLLEAVRYMPCLLEFVAFCRNNNAGKMVVVDSERLIELAKQTAETRGIN